MQLEEIMKSRHKWIKETLTRLRRPAFWDCSLYGKGPQNDQHQAQTEFRIHSFFGCNRKTSGEYSLDFILP